MIYRLRRRLGRLRVSQRLALLVLVPLAAVVGLAVPVVIDRVDRAQAQASIADEAETRRTVGVLLEELQRERLLSLMYLALPDADSADVIRQSQAVNDALDEVRTKGDARLRPGVSELTTLLGIVRPRVLDRSLLSMVAHEVFSQGVEAVLNNIPAPTAAGTDAVVPPAAPLDELLRSNEQAARFGTAVLVSVTEPVPGRDQLAAAKVGLDLHTKRFTQLGTVNQRSLLTAAENSQAAQRLAQLAENAGEGDLNAKISRIASAVETYTTLRRLVGDRIAREITDSAAGDASDANTEAIVVGLLALLLLLIVAALAAAGARSIAVPLAQLNAAAIAVAAATGRELERVSDIENASESTPALRAVPTTGPGDVADLAAAFNQVQEGAAALLERQVTTRRNVSAMFATVARRTRNLADRQLNLIDVLERQQQDPQLLERLYRLDHVATRLRRSASALLVVSGAADDPATGPMRLADVVRAAAAEIEQFTRVRLEDAIDVAAVPRVVSDLILLVAELLDNAVSYSPPPGPVTVTVSVLGEGCRVSIADVGIGMSADQLAAENHRLIDRERLDIAPTRVLGLFVAGRIARRHDLTVTLLANEPQGVLAHIDLPARLLTAPVGVTAPAPQPRGMRQAARRPTTEMIPVPDRTAYAMRQASNGEFGWFGDQPMLPAGAQPAAITGPISLDDDETGPLPVRGGGSGSDTVPLAAFGMPRAGRTPQPAPPVPSPLVPPSVASGPIVPAAATRPSVPVGPTAYAGPPVPAGSEPPSTPPVRPGSLRDRPQLPGESPTVAIPMPSRPEPDDDPTAAEERGGLSRRVPGRNLPSGIPAAEQRAPDAVDPAAARAEAEAFSQGFARGVASVPGSAPPTETESPAPPPQPPQWPLSAAIPSQRSPHPAERLGPVSGGPGSANGNGASNGVPAGTAPVSAAPVSAAPVSPAPVSPAPVSSAPVSSAPVSSAPVSPAAAGSAPVQPASETDGGPGAPATASSPAAPIGPTPEDAERYPLPTRRVPGRTARNGWAGDDTQPVPAVPEAAPAAPAAPPLDDGQLTRRVPGSHLASELRSPGSAQRSPSGSGPTSSRPQVPLDRDPQSEQLQLDALFAGFARGIAADGGGTGAPDRGTTNGGPNHQPPPSTYQYDSGTPNGAEPQNVERR